MKIKIPFTRKDIIIKFVNRSTIKLAVPSEISLEIKSFLEEQRKCNNSCKINIEDLVLDEESLFHNIKVIIEEDVLETASQIKKEMYPADYKETTFQIPIKVLEII